MLKFSDGRIDERKCIGGRVDVVSDQMIAVMVNEDLTIESIPIENDIEVIVDGEHLIPLVREKDILNHKGIFAKKGDIVRVTKGRKVPVGTNLLTEYTKLGTLHGCKRDTSYLYYKDTNGEMQRINADNTIIIAVKGGTQNQELYAAINEQGGFR